MEVRNSQPSFGMAYRRATSPQLQKAIAEYVDIPKNTRAFKAWVDKQEGFKNFHTELIEDRLFGGISVKITDVKNKHIRECYSQRKGVTGLDSSGSINYPGKKLIARIFYPERLLPANMVYALDECVRLEKAAAQEAKALDIMSKI